MSGESGHGHDYQYADALAHAHAGPPFGHDACLGAVAPDGPPAVAAQQQHVFIGEHARWMPGVDGHGVRVDAACAGPGLTPANLDDYAGHEGQGLPFGSVRPGLGYGTDLVVGSDALGAYPQATWASLGWPMAVSPLPWLPTLPGQFQAQTMYADAASTDPDGDVLP